MKSTIVDAQIIEPIPIGDADAFSSPPLPCPACGTPRQSHSRFCVACGIPFDPPTNIPSPAPPPVSVPSRTGVPNTNRPSIPPSQPTSLPSSTSKGTTLGPALNGASTSFRCQSCGSEIDVSQNQRSLRCPFCDSTYVIELSDSERTKQRPEFVIGFAISKEKAQELFFEWLGRNSFFRPGDLRDKALTDKQQGVYIPFWHFSMVTQSDWSAQIGEYWYRTETYTVRDADGKTKTMTRTVQETEWWPLGGVFRRYYSGYMVSASKGLPQQEASAIQPYQLSAMVRYRPMYIAGWLSEEYSVSREQALAVTKSEFESRERRGIEQFLPGDTHSGLTVSTQLQVGDSDLVLLPVHVLSYRYRDRAYRFLVNGQTGKIYGEKPWSAARITAIVVAAGILVLVLVAVIVFLNRSGIR